jgi:hypothetical protein
VKTKTFLTWANLWRYPELVINVTRGDEIDPAVAGRSLLPGMAAVYTPSEALSMLLDSGEFEAAQAMTENLEANGIVPNAELADMERRLAEARRQALEKIESRQFDLKTRAISAGIPDVLTADLSIAGERVHSAHEILDLWEYEIQAKEEAIQQDLRGRLKTVIDTQNLPVGEQGAWQKMVAACIERRRFQAAEKLLATRRLMGPVSDPSVIPRRPLWPYTDGTRAGLSRFQSHTDEGSSFRREWGPKSGDQPAQSLLSSLGPLATSKAAVLAEDAEYFVKSLDIFLGGSDRNHQIRTWNNGFSGLLYSLNEKSVPRLALCREGVPIWLPRDPREQAPDQLFGNPVVVGYHPDVELEGPILSFTSTLLFRLVGDEQRRINFVRWLARQIKPEDVMPATFDPDELPVLEDEEAACHYAAWFFDLHAISLESDSVLGLIGFYAAQSRHVLCALLGEIGRRLRFRDEIVKTSHVHTAWNSTSFRDTAAAYLLRPVASDPRLLAALACVYLVAEEDEEVTLEYISEWLSVYGLARLDDVPAALRSLAKRGLLTMDSDDNGVWIPSSPRVMLIREHMGDLESYIGKQLSAVRDDLR